MNTNEQKSAGHEVDSISLLTEAQRALNSCRYSEVPLADKIKAYLENPSITADELENVYLKSRKLNCGY